jgi:outer membrane protein assembly factor BamE (lipoprotein component of BamABCDE complex)
MKPLSCALFVSLLAFVSGCSLVTPKETRYLQSAQGQATQEEVRQNLGAPRITKTSQAGEAIWIYEVREVEPGAQNSWAAAGSWCDEYALTFDRNGVLREWTHNSYFHGGENMPASCNSNLGVEKPAL